MDFFKKLKTKLIQKSETQSTAIVEPTQESASEERELVSGYDKCPYCGSDQFVKRGMRKKKHESVQLYLCKAEECGRTFTAQSIKGKHFPLKIIIEGLIFYHLGYTLEQTCKFLGERFGINPGSSTLADWVRGYERLCRFSRLRSFALKSNTPQEMTVVTTMAHRQIYRFRYHRGKMDLSLKEYKHRHFHPLKEYLENVSAETPHQYFQNGLRISDIRSPFSKAQMIVKARHNYANALSGFVLEAVKENKKRHEAVQRFMLATDSVTVATEVPVFIKKASILHLQNELGFQVMDGDDLKFKGSKNAKLDSWSVLTGHIDLLQIRNGQIHILDYKPKAVKEKPIEQLTWYALALSRLTGLRLYEFKCGWFDDWDYFEFYPLHVVYKLAKRKKRQKKVRFKSGLSVKVSDQDKLTIV